MREEVRLRIIDPVCPQNRLFLASQFLKYAQYLVCIIDYFKVE
jgi:hypothetical protein